MMAETKLDKIEYLMRLFWGENIGQTADLRGLAGKALDCAERGGSPHYLPELLGEMQVGNLNQDLDATACEKIAASIRELLGDS
jgi:hypothetical protein